jgi:hypothetical protein
MSFSKIIIFGQTGNMGTPEFDDQGTPEFAEAVKKEIKELRRRLVDTDKIQFGGIFDKGKVKLMRKGGDVELQMVALLMSQLQLGDVISNDWISQNLSNEACVLRFVAINQLAEELKAGDM